MLQVKNETKPMKEGGDNREAAVVKDNSETEVAEENLKGPSMEQVEEEPATVPPPIALSMWYRQRTLTPPPWAPLRIAGAASQCSRRFLTDGPCIHAIIFFLVSFMSCLVQKWMAL